MSFAVHVEREKGKKKRKKIKRRKTKKMILKQMNMEMLRRQHVFWRISWKDERTNALSTIWLTGSWINSSKHP